MVTQEKKHQSEVTELQRLAYSQQNATSKPITMLAY